jgi:phage terminase small subunit
MLTKRQNKFIDAKIAGISNIQAARLAGYSVSSAGPMSTKLMGQAHIKAEISKRRIERDIPEPTKPDMPDALGWLKPTYASPMELMESVMNNPEVPFSIRFESGKLLLPYYHARIGEKGKKESKKEEAHTAGRGKFAAKSAPLRIVK